jgi:DedD protein
LQDHLKERLTGAAILIAVVVLLVPELFHGRPPADNANVGSAAGPPVRSVTIDLGDGAATRPLTENSPAAQPAEAPAATTPTPTPTPAPASAAPATSAPSASAPTATALPPASTANAAAARSATAPPALASPSSAHGGAVQSGWAVQVGSFARRDYADRMVKDAARKGFTVEVAGPDDHGLYRVRSAPRADRSAALALKQKMQASGFKPIVNKLP